MILQHTHSVRYSVSCVYAEQNRVLSMYAALHLSLQYKRPLMRPFVNTEGSPRYLHNLFFLNELVDASELKINEVIKIGGLVAIETGVDKDDKSDIKKVMIKIESLMKGLEAKPNREPGDISIVYDFVSRYLEYYVEQTLLRNIVHRHRSNIRMNSLSELKLDAGIISQIADIYKRTSRKGIRHSQPDGVQPPRYDQLQTDVEVLRTTLKW